MIHNKTVYFFSPRDEAMLHVLYTCITNPPQMKTWLLHYTFTDFDGSYDYCFSFSAFVGCGRVLKSWRWWRWAGNVWNPNLSWHMHISYARTCRCNHTCWLPMYTAHHTKITTWFAYDKALSMTRQVLTRYEQEAAENTDQFLIIAMAAQPSHTAGKYDDGAWR